MKRTRRWKAPVLCNPTIPARQVWRAIYDEPWPKGWRVKWVGWMRGAMGLCKYGSREILLNYGDARKHGTILHTLVHEFVHVRMKHNLRHGKEFDRLVKWGWTRLMEARF